jgi:hypothetical protein
LFRRMNARAMVGQGWFNKGLLAALIAVCLVLPDLTQASDLPEDRVEIIFTLPAGAETGTYIDPRKRFVLRYDAKWMAMPNWAAGAELFCRWAPCQKSVMTSCTLDVTTADGLSQSDLEAGQNILSGLAPPEGYDFGVFGTTYIDEKTRIIKIADMRWAVSGVRVKLFDKVALQTRSWITIANDQMFLATCVAHESIMPRLSEQMDRLLSGFAVTKP